MSTAPVLLPKVRSETLTRSARGMPCALRLPGVCSFNPQQTVLAHLPGVGRGIGSKVSDLHAVFACARCHDVIDRRAPMPAHLTEAYVRDAMLRALCETQARWVEAGLITVTGGKTI